MLTPQHADCNVPRAVALLAQQHQPCTFIIYSLTERRTGRCYVGLTRRTLDQRIAAHATQARRGGAIRPGGLMVAIRTALAEGLAFEQAFTAAILESASDVTTARSLEAIWIDRLEARAPAGLNLMPGGASVGGPANAKRVVVDVGGERREWGSIDCAIRAVNAERARRKLQPLQAGTVYMRLEVGWSPEEALELVPRTDKRTVRQDAVLCGGVRYASLREASTATGVSASALRSRWHRAGQSRDIGADRRSAGSSPRSRDLIMTCPTTGDRLTPTAYAHRMGLPRSTVLRRWHQALRSGRDPRQREAFSEWLRSDQDRRKVITLFLPDGTAWTGGYRELVRRLLVDPYWEPRRRERVRESGIRARLRGITPRFRSSQDYIAWAFGFEDGPPQH